MMTSDRLPAKALRSMPVRHFSVFALLALAVLVALPVSAQAPGAFARFGMGARATVFGPQAADVFGDGSPYHNPALAPFAASQGLEVSGALLDFDREWAAVQVSSPLQPRAGIAGGFIRSAVTGIDGRDASGYATGERSTSELAFFVAFGTRVTKNISGGIGLRIYRSDLASEIRPPTALGLGAGLAIRATDRLTLGLVAEDLFAQYNWNASPVGGGTVADRFPTRFRGGAGYRFGPEAGAGRLVVAAEAEAEVRSAEVRELGGIGTAGGFPTEETDETDVRTAEVMARLGAEYQLVDAFAIRAGADRLFLGDAGEIRPSAGFSVRPQLGELDLRIDYAATLEPFGTAIAQTATLRIEL
ncbi:MAG: hypothetical protein AAGI52_11205 [Bacteroidota bacterium]